MGNTITATMLHDVTFQTIESTIPVIVRSMKAKTSSDAELAIGMSSPLTMQIRIAGLTSDFFPLQRLALFSKSSPIWRKGSRNTVPFRKSDRLLARGSMLNSVASASIRI